MSYVYDGTVPTKPTATITDNSTTTGITITGNIDKNVGTYVLTYTATDSAGNKAIPQIATITITPKPVTVTANPATKVYGTANPSFSYVLTGGLEASDSLLGTLGSSGVNAGDYAITSTLSNNNYAITFVSVNKFSISPKPVTITANTATKVYGTTSNPSLGDDKAAKLVRNDSLTGALGSIGLSTSTVGTYDITSTLSHSNYDITFVGKDRFSILKASQSAFSAGNDQDKTFVSGAISGTTFTIMTTGTLSTSPATYSSSNANIATIDANSVITIKAAGTVTIGATSTADNNYQSRYSSFILTIYPTTTTLANATATSYDIKLAWSGVVGSGISYKIYYASETIINFADLATNYSNLEGGALIDNITTTATTVLNLKHGVVYHFVVTVAQNNVESAISNEVSRTLQKPATGTINDSGITWAGNYPSGNNSTCTSSITAPQDCHQGRDAKAASGILGKLGGGRAGFDFTKLDNNGNALAATAGSWSCVKDNYTGLIWEVKTNSGLHYKNDFYTWYNTDANNNRGNAGTINATGTTCDGYTPGSTSTYCNTQAFVARVNSAGLCGASDWQLPSKQQLKSIVDYSSINPTIDTGYFPRAVAFDFWSSTPVAHESSKAWLVYFHFGNDSNEDRNKAYRVRLVRPMP